MMTQPTPMNSTDPMTVDVTCPSCRETLVEDVLLAPQHQWRPWSAKLMDHHLRDSSCSPTTSYLTAEIRED